MKRIVPAFFLALTLPAARCQTSINWTTPITVAGGSAYSSVYPRIALTAADTPLVIWGKNGPNSIYAARWTGSGFGTPVPVHAPGINPFVATWAGAELACEGDTVFVTFSAGPSGPYGQIYTVRSLDGGMSFGDTVRVSSLGTDVASFPSVTVAGGNPVVNFMRSTGSFASPEYVVSRSADGGTTYQPDVSATAMVPGEVCDCCPATLAASGSDHILLFRNAESNVRTIHAAFSSDASASFSSFSEIDLTNWTVSVCPSSAPSGVIVGDTLIYTWMSKAGGPTRVYIGTVNIYDQQVGFNKQIFTTSVGTHNFPVITAKGDTVGVVWEGNVMGDIDVYFSYSTTGAAGIGQKVDTLTALMPNDQVRPDIAFNNGKFHIVYSDYTADEVKYFSGTVNSSIGMTETKTENHFNILSAREVNGSIELVINSPADTRATLQVVNTWGQNCAFSELQIQSGKRTYTVPFAQAGSVYYINVQANGMAASAKCLAVR